MKKCPLCKEEIQDDATKCKWCGSMIPTTVSYGVPYQPSKSHQLQTFSAGLVVLLHFITCGLFTHIWLNLMHGKMPQNRPDDPSAGKAIGFLFIPFFNLYWVFFTYIRLCKRIDEQRVLCGLQENSYTGLAIAMCIINLIPYVGLIGFVVLVPIFAAFIQTSVNELVAVRDRGHVTAIF